MLRSFVLVMLLGYCQLATSQTTVTASFDNQPAQQVITNLEANYDLVFTYTSALIEGQYITAHCEQLPLEAALSLFFAGTSLEFELVSGKYVLLQAKEPVVVPSYRLCGKVVDEYGQGLAFATVFLSNTSSGTTTQEDGTFSLNAAVNLQDKVEISYLGYEAQLRTVAQLRSCPEVQLSLMAFSFAEVLIKEYVTAGIEQSSELDHMVLRPDRIDMLPGLTEADVLQMTQILPGIQSQDESATNLNIRGGTPDQNLILWDGIPVYNGGHFFGMISSFNPYIVEQVDVYRSGFGPEYGGRVAGVIDIVSEDDVPERLSGDLGLNLTHADASVNVPFFEGKAAFLLSGRRAYSDVLESPTFKRISQSVFQRGKIGETQEEQEEQGNIDSNLSFVFDDWNAKWFWVPNDQNHIALSFFGVRDRLDFSADLVEEEERFSNLDELNLANEGFSVSWKKDWTTLWNTSLRYTSTSLSEEYDLQFELWEEEELVNRIEYFQENDIEDRSLSVLSQWQVVKGMEVDFGYNFKDLQVGRGWTFAQNDTIEDRDESAFHAAFVNFKTQQAGRWKAQLGLRWNYANALRQAYFEPRLSLQYIPNEDWQLRASAGRYHQFLSRVVELNDLGLNQQLWVLADDNEDEELPVARSDHYSLGVFFQPSSFQFEIEAYYKTISGLTSFSPAFIDNNLQRDVYEEGTGEAYGIDCLIRNRWSKYQAWLSYSYGRVFYRFNSFKEGGLFPAPHDRPHSWVSVHQLQLNKWTLSLSWNLRSGRVYTVADEVFVEEDGEDNYPIYDYENPNAARLPLYHRMDFSAMYKFPIGKHGANGRIGLSILNLYNRENVLSRQYFSFFEDEDDINDFVIESIDRDMLRFTPNMVVRMAW